MTARVFIVLLMAFPFSAQSASGNYQCTVAQVRVLNDEGILVKDELFSNAERIFRVSRLTGQVVGGLLDNKGMIVSLYDSGSNEMSFKVTAVTSSTVKHAMYLQINEFVDQRLKPFVGIRSPNSVVITGTCE